MYPLQISINAFAAPTTATGFESHKFKTQMLRFVSITQQTSGQKDRMKKNKKMV
jgi:hypothetical protein